MNTKDMFSTTHMIMNSSYRLSKCQYLPNQITKLYIYISYFHGHNCKKALRILPLNSDFFSTWPLVSQSKAFCKKNGSLKKGVDLIFGLSATKLWELGKYVNLSSTQGSYN